MKYQGGIKNFKQITAKLDNMKKAPQAVLDRTLSDARTRVPGWVAKEVVKEYNIPKNEISGKGISKLSIKGKKLPDDTFEYTGELLTAKYFSMKPEIPSVGRTYTLTAKIHKGKKSVRYTLNIERGNATPALVLQICIGFNYLLGQYSAVLQGWPPGRNR